MLSRCPSRRIALLGLLGLAGCGFAPLYGKGAATQGAFAFETDESVMGFGLRARLADRLGPTTSPQFALKATLRTSERAAAITADGDASRLNIIGTADWSLIDLPTGRQIATDTVAGFTSYAATGTTVATQTARDDAQARLAVILADMIVTRVLLAARDLPS